MQALSETVQDGARPRILILSVINRSHKRAYSIWFSLGSLLENISKKFRGWSSQGELFRDAQHPPGWGPITFESSCTLSASLSPSSLGAEKLLQQLHFREGGRSTFPPQLPNSDLLQSDWTRMDQLLGRGPLRWLGVKSWHGTAAGGGLLALPRHLPHVPTSPTAGAATACTGSPNARARGRDQNTTELLTTAVGVPKALFLLPVDALGGVRFARLSFPCHRLWQPSRGLHVSPGPRIRTEASRATASAGAHGAWAAPARPQLLRPEGCVLLHGT